MTNKFLKWNLYDLEKAVQNNTLVELLENILKENNQKKVMEAIKASGYFISYSEDKDEKIEKATFRDVQRKKVDNFIKKNMSDKNIKYYNMWKKEAQYLKNKRNEINSYINNILDTYSIDCEKLISYAIIQFNNTNNIMHICIAHKEYTLFCLGQLLKVLILYNKNVRNKGEKADSDVLSDLWINTMVLREFNEIIQSWMFGEVQIEVDEKGLSITELQGRNSERIISSLSFWDIKDVKNIKSSIEVPKDDDINTYEKILKSKVQEYFYTDDFQEEYLDLKLCNWINIYRYFKGIAIKNKTKKFVKLNIESLRSDLNANGFSEDEIDVIEKYLIFSKESKDLFDSFMIKEENVIYFVPEFYNFIDASQSMISIFGGNTFNSKIERKGKSFENHINNLLMSCKKIKAEKNIIANEQGEKYEIDLVFQLNDILFFCECKTQLQHQNMRGYFRNRIELEGYLKKFKRNYNYFTKTNKGTQIIKQKMGLLDIKQTIPVFISNIVYTDIKIDNIYITDEPRIWRYLKRNPALVHQIDSSGIVTTVALFEDFYKGEINAKQFISYLNNKEEEMKLEYKRIKLWNNKSLNNFGIYSERYIEEYGNKIW